MIAEALRSMPEVESVTFEDSGQAYLNFKRQFKGDAELVKAITEKDLPESFRVLPRPGRGDPAGKVRPIVPGPHGGGPGA